MTWCLHLDIQTWKPEETPAPDMQIVVYYSLTTVITVGGPGHPSPKHIYWLPTIFTLHSCISSGRLNENTVSRIAWKMAREKANSAMNEDKQIGMSAWIAASPVRFPLSPSHNELLYK